MNNKIKKCEIKFSNKSIFLHNCNNLNNLKSVKYFNATSSESQIKKALTKYREDNSKKISICKKCKKKCKKCKKKYKKCKKRKKI